MDNHYHLLIETQTPTLFKGEKNAQLLTPDRLSRFVTKYIKQADIGKPGSCHLFRHTVITLMMDNDPDIRFIQQILGRASIDTTEIYTHVGIVKLKQIRDMTHLTMHRQRQTEIELEATEEALFSTPSEEKMEDETI